MNETYDKTTTPIELLWERVSNKVDNYSENFKSRLSKNI